MLEYHFFPTGKNIAKISITGSDTLTFSKTCVVSKIIQKLKSIGIQGRTSSMRVDKMAKSCLGLAED